MTPAPVTAVVRAGLGRRSTTASLASLRAQTLPPREVVVVGPRPEARNAAIARAATPRVLLLDAGDRLFPPCLERLEAALAASGADFAYAYWRKGRSELANLQPWDPDALRSQPFLEGPALLRRSAWAKLGGFRPAPRGRQEHDFWLRLADAGGWGVQVPELLGACRAIPGFPPPVPQFVVRAALSLLHELR
jgi:hypothetical protein